MARTRAGGKESAASGERGNSKLSAQLIENTVSLIKIGVSVDRALLAQGIAPRTIQAWRSGARGGGTALVAFEKFAQAEAEGEVRDVATTASAAWPERKGVRCKSCGEAVQVDLAELEGTHRILSIAATHAMDRLQRRFPSRWSMSVRVTVEGEQEQFLDVARQVLPPEWLEKLLDAYASSATAGAGQSEG